MILTVSFTLFLRYCLFLNFILRTRKTHHCFQNNQIYILSNFYIWILFCLRAETNIKRFYFDNKTWWFASDTPHIVFIHIPFVVKPVHIFMARKKVSKSCLVAELCFHHFVHFDCITICHRSEI